MVSPTPNAVPSESLVPVDAPESNVAEEIAGVAAALRVTVVVAAALRPSLASVPDAEPARLMSAVVLVVRLILPEASIVAVPPVAAPIAVSRVLTLAVLPAPMPIDRLLLAIEPVFVVPVLKLIVLLLTIRKSDVVRPEVRPSAPPGT